jgi:hypothetical protein
MTILTVTSNTPEKTIRKLPILHSDIVLAFARGQQYIEITIGKIKARKSVQPGIPLEST